MPKKTYLFIGLSALIHLSVAVTVSQHLSETVPVEHGRSAINVEITQNSIEITDKKNNKYSKNTVTKEKTNHLNSTDVSIHKEAPPVVNSPSATHQQTVAIHSANSKPSTEIKQQQPAPISVDAKKTENKDNSKEINTASVIAILQQELSRHFYYPKSAQRKNWQGLVILSFTITPSGIIDQISVNQSSGYNVLDSAAVNALGKIKRQDELAIALNGFPLRQLLPVTYKLTN